MPDSLTLPPAPASKSRRGWLVLGLIMICAAIWLYGSHVSSPVASSRALVEGRMYAVSAPVSGRLLAVPVDEGQTVRGGETLALMDDVPLHLALAEAREALRIARQGGVPSAQADPAQRERRDRADREADLNRVEEQHAREALEHWTAEHARAVLTLRSPAAVAGAAREGAVADEAAARRNMEAARHTLAEASRRRAEADAQARRARQGGQSARPGPEQVALWEARVAQAERDVAGAALAAPEAGTVIRLSVKPGQTVNRGDFLLNLIPADQGGLWVTAAFDRRDMLRLRPGQACRVEVENGPVLEGEIASLAPEGNGGTARVVLRDLPADAGLLPGQAATVTVRVE